MHLFSPALGKLGHSQIFQGNQVAHMALCLHKRSLKCRLITALSADLQDLLSEINPAFLT